MYYTVPLHKRPMYSAFRRHFWHRLCRWTTTWRIPHGQDYLEMVFLHHVPFGGMSFLMVLLALKLPQPKGSNLTYRQQLAQLDPLGTIFFLPSITCLILALQWGGTTYSWSSWRIVLLLVLFSALLVIFAGIQIWKGDSGTLPPRILLRLRRIAASVIFIFCAGSSMMLIVYYLPIWFQVIKGTSAFESGICMIPTVLALRCQHYRWSDYNADWILRPCYDCLSNSC